MFVPSATRLASEWPADLLLLGVYCESESDWPGIDCDQRDVTVIQSSEIRASVIEKSDFIWYDPLFFSWITDYYFLTPSTWNNNQKWTVPNIEEPIMFTSQG